MKIITAMCAFLFLAAPVSAESAESADSAKAADSARSENPQLQRDSEFDAKVQNALADFKAEVPEATTVIEEARGYLIFPTITKAGLGIGGEYGKGALIKDGKTVAYYSTKSASVGLQAGVERKSMVMAFMSDEALENFRKSDGWEAGVDGAVTVINRGATGRINTAITQKPIVAFVYGKTGLMADVSLSGSKFSQLESVG